MDHCQDDKIRRKDDEHPIAGNTYPGFVEDSSLNQLFYHLVYCPDLIASSSHADRFIFFLVYRRVIFLKRAIFQDSQVPSIRLLHPPCLGFFVVALASDERGDNGFLAFKLENI